MGRRNKWAKERTNEYKTRENIQFIWKKLKKCWGKNVERMNNSPFICGTLITFYIENSGHSIKTANSKYHVVQNLTWKWNLVTVRRYLWITDYGRWKLKNFQLNWHILEKKCMKWITYKKVSFLLIGWKVFQTWINT
jgi:hypothetical protein